MTLYYMEKGDPYFDDGDGSQREESDRESYTDEAEHGVSSWHEDGYLSSEFKDEPDGQQPEPEPPDSHHTLLSHPKPRSSWKPSSRAIFHPTYKSKTRLHYDDGYEYLGPEFFLFSGLDYQQWKTNMQKYFWYYRTPNEEKISIALGQLMGEALKWWNREEYERWYYKEPTIKTWGNLKWIMRERYSPQGLQENQNDCPIKRKATTTNENGQGLKPKTRLTFKEETDKMNKSFDHVLSLIKRLPCTKIVETGLGTKEELDTIKDEPKAMAQLPPLQDVVSKPRKEHEDNASTSQDKCCVLKSLELTCYRCHEKGHFATTCPKRQLEKSTPLGLKTGTNELNVPSNLENVSSCIIHLSLPKVIDAGLERDMESTNEKDFPRITIEEPTDIAASQHVLLTTENKCTDTLHQVSNPLTQFVSNDLSMMTTNLLNADESKENVGPLNKHMETTSCLKTVQVVDNFCESICEKEMVRLKMCSPIYISKTVLTHLFLAKSVEIISGTMEKHIDHKEDSPKTKLSLGRIQNQETSCVQGSSTPMHAPICEPQVSSVEHMGDYLSHIQTDGVMTLKLSCVVSRNHEKVNDFFQLKEEPPDAPHITKPTPYQGKKLTSQNRMKANLLSLGADCTISRSKFLEGRGYDAVIKPATSTHHGVDLKVVESMTKYTKDKGETNFLGEHIKDKGETIFFDMFQLPKLNNHANIKLYQANGEVIADTSRMNLNLSELDLRTLNRVFQPEKEEPSDEETSSRNLTQQRSSESWNQVKSCSESKDMIFTSQVNLNSPGLDLQALFGILRSNQKELGYKPTWYRILIHQGRSTNWIHTKPRSEEEVIQFLNQIFLHLPYMESYGFGSSQSPVWRPGESLTQLEGTNDTLRCIPHHWIQWTRSYLLTHQEHLALSLFGCVHTQQLFPFDICEFKTFQVTKKVPKKLTYPSKPSRYKGDTTFSYLAEILTFKPNGYNSSRSQLYYLFYFNFVYFVSFVVFMNVVTCLRVEPIKLKSFV